MRIRFDSSDGDLPLGKILIMPVLIIVIKSVFTDGNRYIIHKFIYMNVSMNYKKHAQHLFIFISTTKAIYPTYKWEV